MEQTVYADIFFLINFSMDFLSLFIAAKLLERPIGASRFALASLFGGVYACVALFLPLGSVFSFLADALACVLMAFIATLKRRELKSALIFSLVLSAVSILLGGAMTALFNLFNKIGVYRIFGDGAQSDGVSVWFFAILAIISGAIAFLGGGFFKRRAVRRQGRLEISYLGKSLTLPCLCDSGNLLREPISNLPCVIVDADAARAIFPQSFIEAVYSCDISKLSEREQSRVRLVFASSAVAESALVAIRVDSLRLDFGKGKTTVNAYLALSREKIFADGMKALVPCELAFGTA